MRNKKELRKEILARRNALTQEEQNEKSILISQNVIALEEFQKSNKVLLYEAIRSEVDTQTIFREARKIHKEIYYPRVLGDKMEFYRVDERTEFDISPYGIKEPMPSSTVPYEPCKRDTVFVVMPGAVFDTEGNRIGYGGGYYDKYLQRLSKIIPSDNICKVAVAYECQMVELGTIKLEPHDIKVDYVMTERK